MGIKRNENVPVQMPPDFMLAVPSRDVLCFHKQDCVNRVVNYRVRMKSHKLDNTTALLCIVFTLFCVYKCLSCISSRCMFSVTF